MLKWFDRLRLLKMYDCQVLSQRVFLADKGALESFIRRIGDTAATPKPRKDSPEV